MRKIPKRTHTLGVEHLAVKLLQEAAETSPTDMLNLKDTFVIVPAYSEEPVIRGVVEQLCNLFPHVVIVNDGSSDNTLMTLRALPVTIINHAINLGQGAALQTGLTYALSKGASYIVTFDSDGQHRVEDAVAAVRQIKAEGCDAICGSRFLGKAAVNIPRLRKLMIKTAVLFSNTTMGTTLTDTHNGLRALSRKAAACIDISQSGMAHASEIISQLMHHRMNIKEVPVQINYTAYSLSKGQSSLNAINIVFDLLIGRFLK